MLAILWVLASGINSVVVGSSMMGLWDYSCWFMMVLYAVFIRLVNARSNGHRVITSGFCDCTM